MSAAGERFVSLRSRLEGLDSARTDRVERLRQAIASGSYRVSGDAITAAMLNDPATAGALGVK
jgi:anti-sigma28 factor (negative regulator of flagellin synthesis)